MEERQYAKALQKAEWAGNSRSRQEKRGKQASRKAEAVLAAFGDGDYFDEQQEQQQSAAPLTTAKEREVLRARRARRADAQQERLAAEWVQLAEAEEKAQQRQAAAEEARAASQAARQAKLLRKREQRRSRKGQARAERAAAVTAAATDLLRQCPRKSPMFSAATAQHAAQAPPLAATGGGRRQQLPPGLEPPDDWAICAITAAVFWAFAARALYLYHDRIRTLLSGECQRAPEPAHALSCISCWLTNRSGIDLQARTQWGVVVAT